MPETLAPTVSIDVAAARSWDAVVIGAGPAGSVAAAGLARLGARTLLVDRVALPRNKVCGCCLAPSGVQALHDAGLGRVLHGATPIDRFRLHAYGRTAQWESGGYLVLGRDALDTRLAIRARESGAELLWPAIAHITPTGEVSLSQDGRQAFVNPRVIIAADGIGGSSARDRPGSQWQTARASLLGAGASLQRSPVPLAVGQIAMLCDRRGYVGLVRLPDGRVVAGAALDPRAVRDHAGQAELAAGIVAEGGGDPGVIRAAKWRGTPLLTRRRAAVESGNVLFVGDAAGYVEPLTGEGMSWAIQGALLAAPCAHRIVTGAGRAGEWSFAHRRLLAHRQRRCAIITRLARSSWVLHGAIRLAAASPRLASLIARWGGFGASRPQGGIA